MKLVRRSVVLRILAAAGVNMYVYAGFLTLRSAFLGTNGGGTALLLYLLTAVLGFTAGRFLLGRVPAFLKAVAGSRAMKFITFMLNVNNSERFVSSTAAWFTILLPLTASCIIYGRLGASRLLFELLPVTAAYIVALKQSRLGASQILSNASVYIGLFILVISLEFTNIFRAIGYLKPWLLGAFYFFIFAFLVVRNQEDIDSNIFDKKHIEKSILPKNLRSFNTVTVCVVFGLILLLFNLKTIVITIFHLLGQLYLVVMKIILWIMQKLLPLDEEDQGNGISGDNSPFDLGIHTISPVGNFIFNIVRSFALYYIVYRVLLTIIRTMPIITRKLAALLKKLFSLERGEKADTNSDYTDETETVVPERNQKGMLPANRSIKRGKKDIRQIKDPVMKVRYMFAVILQMLPKAGIQPDRSDTPTELAGKAGISQDVADGLSPFAIVYNKVRYGEKIPDQGMLDDAERSFNKALDAMEHKR